MRNLSITILSVSCMLFSLCSFAQGGQNKTIPINEPDYNKPKLFADLPDRVEFNPNNLSNLLELQVGQSVDIPLTTGINFTGQVISTSNDPKAASIVIRLTNRVGARLIFTRITDENNNVNYIGRIISQTHGDSFEIVFENNQYYFKKKGFYDLMTE